GGVSVAPRGCGFCGARNDVIVPPAVILLKTWTVGCPDGIPSLASIMSAVTGRRGVPAHECRDAANAVHRPTQAGAGREMELAVPLRGDRQAQLELVLW